MNIISRFTNFWLDFIFPKKKTVIELESIPTGDLVSTLPPAPDTEREDLVALFDYKHPVVREMIWELKYGGNKQVASKLGQMVYDLLVQELSDRELFSGDWGRPVLMPVPISDKRRFERGWNQIELLAKAITEQDKGKTFKYLPRHLTKVRHTDSQTHTASRQERFDNIKDSMRVIHPPAIEGRCVVVLDDVLTTGATFSEAKRALQAAGAKKVLCVAVAH